jgi:hypothetical protein
MSLTPAERARIDSIEEDRRHYTEIDAKWLNETLDDVDARGLDYTQPWYFYQRDIRHIVVLALRGLECAAQAEEKNMDSFSAFEEFAVYAKRHLGASQTFDAQGRLDAVRRYSPPRHVHVCYDHGEHRVFLVRMDTCTPGTVTELDRRWLDGGPKEWVHALYDAIDAKVNEGKPGWLLCSDWR